MLVADGFDHVAYEDDLLEAVVDLEQRGFSCATFSGVGSWYADWSGRDGGGQHVDQVVELLRPAQPVAHAPAAR